MYFISHRGNIEGPNIEKENSPNYVNNALLLGFDVEIDVWYCNSNFFLGHDKPSYKISESYLENKLLWCHAKNFEALDMMMKNRKITCFWHQEDDFTITSNGHIWAYPSNKNIQKFNCIDVMPERHCKIENYNVLTLGVCSDYIKIIRGNHAKKSIFCAHTQNSR